jgi:hypothetical protein
VRFVEIEECTVQAELVEIAGGFPDLTYADIGI